MFNLTHRDNEAFCYRGFFIPGGEALRAAGCNRIPVTKPSLSLCVQVLVTQAATFNLCSILGNEHTERGLGSFLEAVRRVFSGPVYPTPDKLKNAALFLRLGLPSYPLKTLSKPERQGSCGSWKTWKVLEFYSGIFHDWKVQEKGDWSWKILEIY